MPAQQAVRIQRRQRVSGVGVADGLGHVTTRRDDTVPDRGDACLAEALRQWLARQPSRQGLVDGAPRAVFHNGGVQGYLEGGDDTNLDSCTIHLHSHGEDAFDSLSDCSKQIARFARARGCEQRLQWVEARHDRSDHQLRWA